MAAGTQASELRELSDEDLVGKLREAKEELFNLRFQAATGQLENNSRLRVVRKDIARIYTLMRERELGIETVDERLMSEKNVTETNNERARLPQDP